jgi:putative tricarboxylic transport membrane protein
MSSDRWTGLFFIGLGTLLFTVIIPWQVETVGYGWLKPRTLPLALSVVIALCGLALQVRPPDDARPGASRWGRAVLFSVVLGLGLGGVWMFGFLVAAPPMALAVMLLAHERRPLWLILGAAGMPALIWLAVEVLLERPLP